MSNRGYILLFGHMRGQTTLLAHILGSHPEIDGYTELHQHYESPIDLRNMTKKIEEHTGEPRRGRYALDKLLHNKAIIDAGILARTDVKSILLVRDPRDSIPSIMRAGRYDEHVLPISDAAVAVDYYVGRLKRLEAYSEFLGPRAALVEAEVLTSDTEAILAGLTRFLGLASPLSPSYEQFRLTGKRGLGDMGPNIHAGRVLRDDERRRSDDVLDIPDAEMARAVAVYETLLPAWRERHPRR